jgi:hypothetical protein
MTKCKIIFFCSQEHVISKNIVSSEQYSWWALTLIMCVEIKLLIVVVTPGVVVQPWLSRAVSLAFLYPGARLYFF